MWIIHEPSNTRTQTLMRCCRSGLVAVTRDSFQVSAVTGEGVVAVLLEVESPGACCTLAVPCNARVLAQCSFHHGVCPLHLHHPGSHGPSKRFHGQSCSCYNGDACHLDAFAAWIYALVSPIQRLWKLAQGHIDEIGYIAHTVRNHIVSGW
jgi:hypothetical protein